ncbi:MAG: diguanylate cyclase [Gallionella sp.]|nr:MAG: diguanylate cyclase [Gallionella sp.]
MAFYDVTRDEMQGILAQLEQALYNHQQWHAALIRTLVCQLPGDQHDISPGAHLECRFGQWYYGNVPGRLRDHAGFIALGAAHQHMHQLAASLLVSTRAGKQVTSFDYDNFANALDRMRLEISALERELEDSLYNHDSLTGAINRYGILPALREQQELIKRGTHLCCIAMMDLDKFKAVNDLYGHLAGDQVLISLVHYLIEHLRPYDKVFRYGGEELLLFMPHTELTPGYNMLERLREGLAAMPIDIGGKEPIHITASFGLVLLDADIPVEASIDHADKAMYAAKSAGRNCVRVWDTAYSGGCAPEENGRTALPDQDNVSCAQPAD